MSQQATKQQVHSLYRAYIRLVRDWPADKVRPNRDMKQVLAARVEETFRKPLQDGEPIDIQKAERQLDALERLLDNEFKQKYPLSDKILSPAGNPNYYSSLLSSLNANKDSKKGPFARFFGN
ncbi:hypothetical protein BC940DRAFT_310928 [Gongronella butleri]|nr:hypothetical protein BC940DRAFT_310928 [Gongronella butleri]